MALPRVEQERLRSGQISVGCIMYIFPIDDEWDRGHRYPASLATKMARLRPSCYGTYAYLHIQLAILSCSEGICLSPGIPFADFPLDCPTGYTRLLSSFLEFIHLSSAIPKISKVGLRRRRNM